MLKMRLQRVGRKHDPSYRIIVTESTNGPKSGNHLEIIGIYDPRRDTKTIKKERVEHWLGVGAQLSGTVHNLFVSEGIIKSKKINVLPKRTPLQKASDDTTVTKNKADVSVSVTNSTNKSDAETKNDTQPEVKASEVVKEIVEEKSELKKDVA